MQIYHHLGALLNNSPLPSSCVEDVQDLKISTPFVRGAAQNISFFRQHLSGLSAAQFLKIIRFGETLS